MADRERVAAAHAQTNALQTRRLTALELRIKFLQEQVISAKSTTQQPQQPPPQQSQPMSTTTAAAASSSAAFSATSGKAGSRDAGQQHQHPLSASAATSPTSRAEAESEEWGCDILLNFLRFGFPRLVLKYFNVLFFFGSELCLYSLVRSHLNISANIVPQIDAECECDDCLGSKAQKYHRFFVIVVVVRC